MGEDTSNDERERNLEGSPLLGDLNDVLEAVDEFEDKVQELAYEELVPLDLKIALEEKVFGWSNLCASILGHVVVTCGAYLSVFIVLNIIPWQLHNETTTHAVKVILSMWAAVAAFRLVRRRRFVWLRAPYGSLEYKEDEERRWKSVRETDSSTILGRIRRRRNVYLHKRVQKTLTRAEESFGSWKEKSTKGKPLQRRPSFSTFPTKQTKSIENDQVLFSPGPIKNMPYSHGCFFGAAPFLLANPHWISILRRLMPDVYVEISRRVLRAPARRLIHWAENNPVVAAYGTANEWENKGNLVNLEWDVFLDPRLVRRVELVIEQRDQFLEANEGRPESWTTEKQTIIKFLDKELENRSSVLLDTMLIAHGNLTQLLLEQSGHAKSYIYARVKRTRRTLGGGMYARQWMAVYAEALRLGVRMAEKYNHAPNMPQPEDPVSATDSESDDAGSVKTAESSMVDDDSKVQEKKSLLGSSHGDLVVTSLSGLSHSKCPNTSIKESVAMLKRVIRKERPIGLVLDMKSRHVPRRIWALIINKLNAAGARVQAIASFTVDEIRDISRFCHEPVTEIIFCHSAGDMQQSCHDGRIFYGDTISINGGSFLWETPSITTAYLQNLFFGDFDPAQAMQQYHLLPFISGSGNYKGSTIKSYKDRLNLKIGIYVQEFGIDEAALDVLVRFVNENPDIFEYGFCWGGINGVTVRGIRPDRWTATDGFHTQRYAGASWNPLLSAEDISVGRRTDYGSN